MYGVTEAANQNYTFAKKKFADGLLIIQAAINLHEGLYSACVESFAQIDPNADLPKPISVRFQKTMLRIGCEFNANKLKSLSSTLCALDLQSARLIVDELQLLATVLSLYQVRNIHN